MKLTPWTPGQPSAVTSVALVGNVADVVPFEIIYNVKGKQLNISVSAANTWDDCNLKWLFDYYYKMPRVEKESTRTGNGVHDVLETHLKTGEWKFEGKPLAPKHRYRVLAERGMKASGLTVIPGKGVQDGWETEEWTPNGVYCGPLRFKGKVDIHRVAGAHAWHDCASDGHIGVNGRHWNPSGKCYVCGVHGLGACTRCGQHEWDPDGMAPSCSGPKLLEIWDWKTAKDPLASYNPTPTSLGYLRQPLAYGYVMALKYGLEGLPISARYIYMATVGNSAFPMDADEPIPWSRVLEEWAKLEHIATGMAALAKRAEGQEPAAFVHTVSYKTGACRNYGGCGRQGVCPFSPANRTNPAYVNPTITQSIDTELLTMSSVSGLAALGALAGVSKTPAAQITPVATVPIVPVNPAPPPPAADAEGKMATLVLQLQAMLASGPFATGLPVSMLGGMAGGVGVDAATAAAAAGLVQVGAVYKLPAAPVVAAPVVAAPVVAAATTTAPARVTLKPGDGFAHAEALAAAQGTSVTELVAWSKANGHPTLVFAYGLYCTGEDQVQAAAQGAAGVGWLYAKYDEGNDAVAAVVETIAQVEAPAAGTKPTSAQEQQAGVAWLGAQDWNAEGFAVADVIAALKAGPLAHRQRLGIALLEKIIKRFNGKNPPVLQVSGDRKRVELTDLAKGNLAQQPAAPAAVAPVVPAALAATAVTAPIVVAAPSTGLPARMAGVAALAAQVNAAQTAAVPNVAEQLAAAETPAVASAVAQPDMAALAANMNTAKPGSATVTLPGGQPTAPGGTVTLYVDVYADTGNIDAQPFEAWADQYTAQVMDYARQQGLDGADTGTWQLINFGKGAGLFARVFATCFAAGQVPNLTVDSRSPLAPTFLAAARASGKCLILRGK